MIPDLQPIRSPSQRPFPSRAARRGEPRAEHRSRADDRRGDRPGPPTDGRSQPRPLDHRGDLRRVASGVPRRASGRQDPPRTAACERPITYTSRMPTAKKSSTGWRRTRTSWTTSPPTRRRHPCATGYARAWSASAHPRRRAWIRSGSDGRVGLSLRRWSDLDGRKEGSPRRRRQVRQNSGVWAVTGADHRPGRGPSSPRTR